MNTERTCGNCKFLGIHLEVVVTVPDDGPLGQVSRRYYPCLCNAVDPDAGPGSVVLLGPESHCRYYADAWEPLDDADADADAETCETYGVRPGVDFPATLHR